MPSDSLEAVLDSQGKPDPLGPPSPELFGRVLQEAAGSLRQFLHRQLKRPDLVADAVQETHLRMLRYRGIGNAVEIRALLFRVAGTVVTDLYRRTRSQRTSRHDTLEGLELIASDPAPERIVQASQDLGIIKAAIANLPPRCREVFLLHRFEGMSYKEIAECFGTSERTVENQVARALATCREAMGERRR